MKFSSFKALTAAALFASFATSVSAGTATGNMTVTASVVPKCTITSIDAMAFGTYVQENGAVNASANIIFACPVGTAYDVGIDGLSGGIRNMANGANNLQYNLYTDPARSIVWGLIGGNGVTGTMGPGGTLTLPVYGQVFDNVANRAVPSGAYTGTVVVTISY